MGEEIQYAGSQTIRTRLIPRISKYTAVDASLLVEDSNADSVFEMYSRLTVARSMAFTNDELRARLPFAYNLTPTINNAVNEGIEQSYQG